MKTILTALIALTLSSGTAIANNHSVPEKKAKAPEAPISFVAVIEENIQLRNQVEALANQNAEMQSTLEYRETMSNILNQWQAKENADAQAEVEAVLAYHKTMSALQQSLVEN